MQTTRGTTLSSDESVASTPHRRRIDRRVLWALVAVVGLTIDQITKQLAVTRLDPQHPVPVLGPLLRLQLVWNDGAAFSLGGGGQFTAVFTCFASAVFIGVTWYVFARLRHRGWALVLGLLTAGLLGNLTDRLLRPPSFGVGHVVDFLQLPYWPIFNVADMCVTAAAVGIIWLAVIKNVSPGAPPEASAEDEPAGDEPAEVEPAEVEPAGVEPAGVEPAGVEPAGDEPANDESAKDGAGR